MHDTAYLIGNLFLKTYGNVPGGVVLDVGSSDVNGTLRDAISPDMSYVGIDTEMGSNVDMVVDPEGPFPFDSGTFDTVVCSSVFEHDAAFWETFGEMCRVTKPGGFIYVNSPSNGPVHRYPADCWRFYPDAGKALSRWSQRGSYPTTLIESVVANRLTDQWNDFVAVFQRDGLAKVVESRLHQYVDCVNVYDSRHDWLLHPEEFPEDMLITQRLESTERARAVGDTLAKRMIDMQGQFDCLSASLSAQDQLLRQIISMLGSQ